MEKTLRLLNMHLHNFGSYRDLYFNFNQLGLTLVHGDTGSGKSTLQDAPIWILFGVTSKTLNASEIQNWNNLNEKTLGTLNFEINGIELSVIRIRGKNSENDLYWHKSDDKEHKIRGKDILDSQKQLNSLLGFDSDTYSAATRSSEFSSNATFFIDLPKKRKELFSSITTLKTPNELLDKITMKRIQLKRSVNELKIDLSNKLGKSEYIEQSIKSIKQQDKIWNLEHEEYIQELYKKQSNFVDQLNEKFQVLTLKSSRFAENLKKEIDAQLRVLKNSEKYIINIETDKCEYCGKQNEELHLHSQISLEAKKRYTKLKKTSNPYEEQLNLLKNNSTNTYTYQIDKELQKKNPYSQQLCKLLSDFDSLTKVITTTSTSLKALEYELNSLEHLSNLCFKLRATLLETSVNSVQKITNYYLSTYFDSEFRLKFVLSTEDKLDIIIDKHNIECSFRQLSKGQRGLLKLCFILAVMEVSSNNLGIHFNTIMLDEAFDGLDSSLKLKAFNLLEYIQLNYENILLIDHFEEFKTMFNSKFLISVNNEYSEVIRNE